MGKYKSRINCLLREAAKYKLKGTEYRVLLYLVPELSFEEYSSIKRKEICEGLSIKKTNLAIALQNLIDAGFLAVEKIEVRGKNLKFKLSTNETVNDGFNEEK